MKISWKKSLDEKGLSKLDLLIGTVTVVVLSFVGMYIYNHNGKSHAGSDNFESLGVVNWNPNLTSYFANSKFYSFACITPSSDNVSAVVTAEIVATSFVPYMKSGNYLPSVSSLINGTTTGYGANWQFGNLENIDGAYIVYKTTTVPLTGTFQSGPLATNYWPTVLTSPIQIKNIHTC